MLTAQLFSDPVRLGAALLQRTNILLRMKEHFLDVTWTGKFTIPQLQQCCDRMGEHLPDVHVYETDFQKELIQNPAFAYYYARILRALPDEENEESEAPAFPSGNSNSRSLRAYRTAQTHSRRDRMISRLLALLNDCWKNECDMTAFPVPELIEALDQDWLTDDCRLCYLINFAPLHLSRADQQTVSLSLSNCVNVPLFLDDGQRTLLQQACVGTRVLFTTRDFEEVRALLESAPGLLEVANYLHEQNIDEDLIIDQYRLFAADPGEYYRLMKTVFDRMAPNSAESFLLYWKKSGYPLVELQTMAQRIEATPDMDLDAVFARYPGYINLLYGQRFKTIDLAGVRGYQEDILLYAIVKNKKRFIHLVDENADAFLSLPRNSLLLEEELYKSHFNLNELTERDLKECASMDAAAFSVELLPAGRMFTFPELRALCGFPEVYLRFYLLLRSEKQDYRLRVIKQLIKRDVLTRTMLEDTLTVLAGLLDQKPLYDWMQDDFAHIEGLQPADAVQLLMHLPRLRYLLPSMRTRTDAALALRHVELADQFTTIDDLKKDIVSVDAEWRTLSEAMGLSEQFHSQYQEGIFSFLCQNGAYVANTYRSCLGEVQETAFLRVVKAELMGKLSELKYYEGDLQKELDFPMTERVKSIWKENSCVSRKGLIAQEHDDFFSTMLLGTQPQRTCLSYLDGQYRSCLLAGFDSNKKVLYATLGGRIVGRAYLRLTKGRLTRTKKTASEDNGFTFVDLENVEATRAENVQNNEYLTLFLEHPYISGVNPDVERQIKALFIELAVQKTNAMGTILVLSRDYQKANVDGFAWTRFDIYISKTKAGAQYLDSLDGHASVSAEGSYKSNSFLILESSRNPVLEANEQ